MQISLRRWSTGWAPPAYDMARAHAEAARINIPGRLERLPMTSYQKRVFTIIATAWLADQVDVALLTEKAQEARSFVGGRYAPGVG